MSAFAIVASKSDGDSFSETNTIEKSPSSEPASIEFQTIPLRPEVGVPNMK